MVCPCCGETTLVEISTDYRYEECGLSNITLLGISALKCDACGGLCPLIANIEGLHQAIAHALISKRQHLQDEEIYFLRSYLGWTEAGPGETVTTGDTEDTSSRLNSILKVLVRSGDDEQQPHYDQRAMISMRHEVNSWEYQVHYTPSAPAEIVVEKSDGVKPAEGGMALLAPEDSPESVAKGSPSD